MRGASRDSLAAAQERLEPLLARGGASALGQELYAVAGLLDSSVGLRRALTDSTRSEADRAALVQRLLGTQVSGPTLDVVSGLVRARWSEQRDLGDALEALGTQAMLAGAESDGVLDSVEDELFRFSRLVAGDRALTAALDDARATPAQRGALVDDLLARRADPTTTALVRQVVTAPRGRRVSGALDDLLEAAAARRARLLAVVTAAVPLTEVQRDRLAAGLARVYGKRVQVQVDVDPEVLGGLRVQVGGEVLDATTASRLAAARRRVVG